MKRVRALWSRCRRWQKIALIVGLLGVAMLTGGFYAWIMADLPDLDALDAGLALPSTRIYDRQGRLLYQIADPQTGVNQVVPLDDLPDCMIEATLATEDANFYRHPGVDIEGVVRALWINLKGGEVVAGGSTITQQVARNLLLDPNQRAERTLRRKLRESVLALQLTRRYSRDDILALYLNQTYYGNLAYGIEAAARAYFGKGAGELTLAECAMLAGLPQAPARYNPLTNPEAAKQRQQTVLGLMVKVGALTQAEADRAYAEQLQYASASFPVEAPHFVAAVWTQLQRDFGEELYAGGLEVITTLDLTWQQAAQDAAQRHLERLNNCPGRCPTSSRTAQQPTTGAAPAQCA